MPQIFAKVKSHEERLGDIKTEVADLRGRLEALKPWRALDIPLHQITPTKVCETCLAVLPTTALTSMLGRL